MGQKVFVLNDGELVPPKLFVGMKFSDGHAQMRAMDGRLVMFCIAGCIAGETGGGDKLPLANRGKYG
ncbi:MAG: hypothetical protein IPK15_06100 [Verrucomicrobia bacterium]|nr:hypothetical protein [Verrucomicrobiota bacterium]